MDRTPQLNPRLVAVALLAGLVLVALVLATGGGFQTSGSSAPSQPVATQPTKKGTTVTPGGAVRGAVSVKVRHLGGHAYEFQYTVRNLGSSTIGGFQINGPRANLYHVRGELNWNAYGDGVCSTTRTGVLVYWSTTSGSGNEIMPKRQGTFIYNVNTTGIKPVTYALSSGTASPLFGHTQGPAASSLVATGPCKG